MAHGCTPSTSRPECTTVGILDTPPRVVLRARRIGLPAPRGAAEETSQLETVAALADVQLVIWFQVVCVVVVVEVVEEDQAEEEAVGVEEVVVVAEEAAAEDAKADFHADLK